MVSSRIRNRSPLLPAAAPPRRISKSALAIIAASIFLAILLAVSTVRNYNKEEQLIKNLLLREALALVRTFEAGARTTMLSSPEGANPLVMLVNETVRENSIAYIRIVDEQDRFITGAGGWFANKNRPQAAQVLRGNEVITTQFKEHSIFEVAKTFDPLTGPGCQGATLQSRFRSVCMGGAPAQKKIKPVIYIGLRTEQLDTARHEDIHHAFFMYGILFLLGSTGFYFLFLYQRMQIVRTTLSNMQLYTENVIESMPAGLISLDTAGRVVSCNSRTEELANIPFAAMKGRLLAEIFPDCPWEEFDLQTSVLDLPVDLTDRDCNPLPVKISSSPLKDHTGTIIGTVLTLRDMREIRRMEQKLERSRRLAALGQMAAGVAHEIRNPLGTLRGFAQYFHSQAKDDPESREYAGLMMSEVDRLNQTISGMLQFAREREPDIVPVEMKKLLDKTASLMEADFQIRNISLQLDIEEDIQLRADPDMLLQVLLNLLRNSIDATPSGGTVTVSIRRAGAAVRIRVRDNGRGMTASERDRMFDPFFTTGKKGTGLGLAVSHQIVEQHEGHFEVDSSPGHGTTITLILPLRGIEQ